MRCLKQWREWVWMNFSERTNTGLWIRMALLFPTSIFLLENVNVPRPVILTPCKENGPVTNTAWPWWVTDHYDILMILYVTAILQSVQWWVCNERDVQCIHVHVNTLAAHANDSALYISLVTSLHVHVSTLAAHAYDWGLHVTIYHNRFSDECAVKGYVSVTWFLTFCCNMSVSTNCATFSHTMSTSSSVRGLMRDNLLHFTSAARLWMVAAISLPPYKPAAWRLTRREASSRTRPLLINVAMVTQLRILISRSRKIERKIYRLAASDCDPRRWTPILPRN